MGREFGHVILEDDEGQPAKDQCRICGEGEQYHKLIVMPRGRGAVHLPCVEQAIDTLSAIHAAQARLNMWPFVPRFPR